MESESNLFLSHVNHSKRAALKYAAVGLVLRPHDHANYYAVSDKETFYQKFDFQACARPFISVYGIEKYPSSFRL